MAVWRDLVFRIRALVLRRQVERELDDELRFHLEQQARSLQHGGMSRAEAERVARLQLGGVEQVKEECRDACGLGFFELAGQNLRFTVRGCVRRPGFAASVVSVLALAIGGVTATFAVADWALLRPLPYPQPDRLCLVGYVEEGGDAQRPRVSFADATHIARSHSGLDHLSLSRWESVTLMAGGEPERLDAVAVGARYFQLFQARPLLGRLLQAGDDEPSAPPAACLSYSLWKRRFAGDPAVVGSVVRLNLKPYTVLGVLTEDFRDPEGLRRHVPIDVWLPLVRSQERFADARLYTLSGRMSDSGSPHSVWQRLSAMPPERGLAVRAVRWGDLVAQPVRGQLLLLLGAVLLVLLIACVNVGGLLLARGSTQRPEIALRLALGASRWRITGQLFTETGLLAVLAALAGWVLAALLLHAAVPLLPAEIPRLAEIRLDWRIAVFTLSISTASALLCGLWPALRNSQLQLSSYIRAGAGGLSGDRARGRLSSLAVVAQVALSLVLVAGAGLLLKSFALLTSVAPGFEPRHVLTAQVRLPMARYQQPERRSAFYERALREVSLLPGVRSAALVTALPLGGSGFSDAFILQDRPPATDAQRPTANWNVVSPAYFRTLEIPLLEGRLPEAADLAQGNQFVVVNRQLARSQWPGESAIGKRLRFGSVAGDGLWQTVLAVVGDVRHGGLDDKDEPQVYQMYPSMPPPFAFLVVRAEHPLTLTGAVRRAVNGVDRDIAVDRIATFEEVLARSVATPRFRASLLAAFGVLALLLASLGLYGAIAYSVEQRRRELGIRLALGATSRRAASGVLWQAGRLLLLGLASGLLGAHAFMRSLRAMVFSPLPLDWPVLVVACVVLSAAGLLAVLRPAWVAAHIDPLVVLRQE
ncbi:ADOP family duplicated permease [Paludibaculum fermentans]|uniref:ABC transporter permease n=1 Tax=Paludibaculum fermentans TaxID=1473598 RepID=UPI003EBFB652